MWIKCRHRRVAVCPKQASLQTIDSHCMRLANSRLQLAKRFSIVNADLKQPLNFTSKISMPGRDQQYILRSAIHSQIEKCDAGSTLKDVTESVGLDGNERTLACACLADRVLVQVMHKRMQLCSMDAVLSPDQAGSPGPLFSLCFPLLWFFPDGLHGPFMQNAAS